MFTDEETGRENLPEYASHEGLTSTHVSLHFSKGFPEEESSVDS